MSDVQTPTVARRRLRRALRSAREEAAFTQEQAADELEWSLSKLIRIEAGTVGVTTTDVKAMLGLYQIGEPARINELVALARLARQRSWWFEFRDDIPPAYAAYLGLEEEASTLYMFQPVLIPGILQTSAYANSILQKTAAGELTAEEQSSRGIVRQLRQERLLSAEHGPAIDAVLDEAVLRRVAGDGAIMHEQLLHLVTLGGQQQVTLRVLPFTAGVTTVNGPFILLEFPDGRDRDAVYYETPVTMSQLVDRADGVVPYRQAFDRLAVASMSAEESLAYIAKIAGEFGASAG